jgi:hypothetical protein
MAELAQLSESDGAAAVPLKRAGSHGTAARTLVVYWGMRPLLPLFLSMSLAPLPATDDDWMPLGQGAAVHKTGNTASVDYKVTPGQFGLALRPTSGGKLAGMTHLQFRVKSDIDTCPASC